MNSITQIEDRLNVGVSDFLAAFFVDENEIIHLRTFQAKNAPRGLTTPHNWETTRAKLATNEEVQNKLRELNQQNGIYVIVNAGGHSDKDITRFNAFFVEHDEGSLDEQHARLDAAPIQPSIRVETKNSVHAYWPLKGDCTEADWRDIQQRLIAYFDGDPQNSNPSRCMRLPGYNHVTYNGVDDFSYKPVEVVAFDPSRRYSVADMQAAFPALEPKAKNQNPKEKSVKDAPSSSTSSQFYSWDELNAELKRLIMSHPTAQMQTDGWWHCKGICHNGSGDTAIMFNPATGAVKCMNDCSHSQLLNAFGLPDEPLTISSSYSRRRINGRKASMSQDNADMLTILLETPASDVGNAECMSALYSSVMRYCHTRKTWLLWDGVRWTMDE
jgi:hypothetical protein